VKLPDIAQRLNLNVAETPLPCLYYFTDEGHLADPAPHLDQLPDGAGVVFRHYGAEDRLARAQAVRRACGNLGLVFFMAGDARAAAEVNADGVHLPEYVVPHAALTIHLAHRAGRLVTAAAHDPAAIQRACRMGVDGIFLGPVFPTSSHPGDDVIGNTRFTAWTRRPPRPVFALGGVSSSTSRALMGSRCAGLAGISGIITAKGT
jgi:thiamine-phosphate pyrophosphorylase